MNYRFFLVFCCAQLLNAAEHTANQLPERPNAQGLQLSLLSEEAPARFDGQDPEPRQLSPRDRKQPENGGNAKKKVSISAIRKSIKDLQEAAGAEHTSYHVLLPQGQPLELVVVVQPTKGPMRFELTPAQRKQNQDDSNDRDEEDQDCCKEVAAACDRMANIVGYLTAGFGAVVAANYLMQQIQENHAKIE